MNNDLTALLKWCIVTCGHVIIVCIVKNLLPHIHFHLAQYVRCRLVARLFT